MEERWRKKSGTRLVHFRYARLQQNFVKLKDCRGNKRAMRM